MDGFHGAFLVQDMKKWSGALGAGNISSVVKKEVKKVIWGARGWKHKLCSKESSKESDLGRSGLET